MQDHWTFRNPKPIRPIRELDEMRRRFEEEFARPFVRAVWEHIPEEEKGWAPAIDVFKQGDNFIVKTELPGVKQEDIDVSIVEGSLVIKGAKKADPVVKNEDYERNEIEYGPFYRTIGLPSSVDTAKIAAAVKDGVLTITLNCVAAAKPQKVVIKSES